MHLTSFFFSPTSRAIALVSYSFRDILKSRVILLLIVASLSIAYAAVFLSASILAGFQLMLVDGAQGYLGDIVISPAGTAESIADIQTVSDRVESHPNVAAINIRSDNVTTVTYDEKETSPYRTIGIDEFDEAQASRLADRLIEGTWIDRTRPEQAVIGMTLADFLVGLDYDGKRIPVGKEITVTTGTGQAKKYTVSGIIDAKNFLPNLFLILPKREIENLPGAESDSEIIVRLKDTTRLEETMRDIEDTNSAISVASWRDEAGYVDDIIGAVAFIMGLINGLLTVSVFIIMSVVIFINVFQKRRQIGIIKSMGASNTFIVTIYILEAIIYATLSYIVGFALYWVIHQYSLQHPVALLIGDFHTVFQPEILQRSLLALLAAALGGSVAPAYLAARTKIVNVIRETV